MPKPEHILQRASEHMQARAVQYDKPDGERSMAATVAAFNVITGHTLTEAEGWMFMVLLKGVRAFQRSGYHADSVEDMAAYVALMGEAKAREGLIKHQEAEVHSLRASLHKITQIYDDPNLHELTTCYEMNRVAKEALSTTSEPTNAAKVERFECPCCGCEISINAPEGDENA